MQGGCREGETFNNVTKPNSDHPPHLVARAFLQEMQKVLEKNQCVTTQTYIEQEYLEYLLILAIKFLLTRSFEHWNKMFYIQSISIRNEMKALEYRTTLFSTLFLCRWRYYNYNMSALQKALLYLLRVAFVRWRVPVKELRRQRRRKEKKQKQKQKKDERKAEAAAAAEAEEAAAAAAAEEAAAAAAAEAEEAAAAAAAEAEEAA